ncbi:MAG TPA: oligosaccharide flippase family protein [Noviherbaspirillum sp.]|uniref:oligosaccharide flippase family protein n=1 Tax=Noviherbaspirillum sp. TaxID=1926288 RepID=UPI002B480519|nr:oligosaccharide flippase family protein [Noviherbaspirillum sp.]HJV87000.1 oligosaccharide flippase family protein [Noviherbaspirillum sp.]
MLLRNSLWNLSGSAVPMVVALATVPLLIHALGVEGFGIVTLVGSVIGYFGVLDVNLSAGAIKYLSEHHAAGDRTRFAETFWFGIMFYGLLGLVGALALFFGAQALIDHFFDVTPGMREATVEAFRIGALGFALSQAQNYLLVVPQALQRYDRSAQSEAFFGVLVNLASVAAALAGTGVTGVITARVAVAVTNLLYLIWLIRGFDLGLAPCWPRKEVRTLLTSFSAYAYLSKIASTLHQHADKLIVGAIAGPVALTFYTVPVTLAGRILGLTYRLSSVIYPRASALAGAGRINELRPVYLVVMRYVTYINIAALGAIVLAGDEFLRRWVGEAFVQNGYPVLVLMTVALLVDSLTNIPSLVNDALGHPRITGRFALANGVFGIATVYFGTLWGGIVGAASGHLLASLTLGLSFLVFVHGRTVPVTFGEALRTGFGRSLAIGAIVIAVLVPLKWLMPAGVASTVAIVCAAMLALTMAGLYFIVGVEERAAMLAFARRLRS